MMGILRRLLYGLRLVLLQSLSCLMPFCKQSTYYAYPNGSRYSTRSKHFDHVVSSIYDNFDSQTGIPMWQQERRRDRHTDGEHSCSYHSKASRHFKNDGVSHVLVPVRIFSKAKEKSRNKSIGTANLETSEIERKCFECYRRNKRCLDVNNENNYNDDYKPKVCEGCKAKLNKENVDFNPATAETQNYHTCHDCCLKKSQGQNNTYGDYDYSRNNKQYHKDCHNCCQNKARKHTFGDYAPTRAEQDILHHVCDESCLKNLISNNNTYGDYKPSPEQDPNTQYNQPCNNCWAPYTINPTASFNETQLKPSDNNCLPKPTIYKNFGDSTMTEAKTLHKPCEDCWVQNPEKNAAEANNTQYQTDSPMPANTGDYNQTTVEPSNLEYHKTNPEPNDVINDNTTKTNVKSDSVANNPSKPKPDSVTFSDNNPTKAQLDTSNEIYGATDTKPNNEVNNDVSPTKQAPVDKDYGDSNPAKSDIKKKYYKAYEDDYSPNEKEPYGIKLSNDRKISDSKYMTHTNDNNTKKKKKGKDEKRKTQNNKESIANIDDGKFSCACSRTINKDGDVPVRPSESYNVPDCTKCMARINRQSGMSQAETHSTTIPKCVIDHLLDHHVKFHIVKVCEPDPNVE